MRPELAHATFTAFAALGNIGEDLLDIDVDLFRIEHPHDLSALGLGSQ